jgi:hypothetical protein
MRKKNKSSRINELSKSKIRPSPPHRTDSRLKKKPITQFKPVDVRINQSQLIKDVYLLKHQSSQKNERFTSNEFTSLKFFPKRTT